jgi:hypothetical protein
VLSSPSFRAKRGKPQKFAKSGRFTPLNVWSESAVTSYEMRSKLSRRALLVGVVLGTALLLAAFALAGATALIVPTHTPGARYSKVTQATIAKTICKSGWTKTIRPPASYTMPMTAYETRVTPAPAARAVAHCVEAQESRLWDRGSARRALLG